MLRDSQICAYVPVSDVEKGRNSTKACSTSNLFKSATTASCTNARTTRILHVPESRRRYVEGKLRVLVSR